MAVGGEHQESRFSGFCWRGGGGFGREELDRFESLQDAHEAYDGPKNAAFAAAEYAVCGWRLGEHAAVAWPA